MSKSWRSWNASANPDASVVRLQWRPSRGLTLALWMLAALVPLSVLASGVPRVLTWPLALGSALWAALEARRYARQAPMSFVLPGGAGPPTCDGCPILEARVHWRGPIARLEWRGPDGGHERCLWWPDTLQAPARRELRLALMQRESASDRGSMAG
jgi:toxin CptA